MSQMNNLMIEKMNGYNPIRFIGISSFGKARFLDYSGQIPEEFRLSKIQVEMRISSLNKKGKELDI